MRRRATAVNTVANTSRTACGSGCTCCLTQVFSNSCTLAGDQRSWYSGCGLLRHNCSPPSLLPQQLVLLPMLGSGSFPHRGVRPSALLYLSPFESFLGFCFMSERKRENGGSPALPLLSDDIMSCRQAWVFCQRFRSVCDGSLADVCPGTHCTQMQT